MSKKALLNPWTENGIRNAGSRESALAFLTAMLEHVSGKLRSAVLGYGTFSGSPVEETYFNYASTARDLMDELYPPATP